MTYAWMFIINDEFVDSKIKLVPLYPKVIDTSIMNKATGFIDDGIDW